MKFTVDSITINTSIIYYLAKKFVCLVYYQGHLKTYGFIYI